MHGKFGAKDNEEVIIGRKISDEKESYQ